jgi:hypothetical protein
MPGSVTRLGRPGAIPELRNNARRTALSVRLVSAMERAGIPFLNQGIPGSDYIRARRRITIGEDGGTAS